LSRAGSAGKPCSEHQHCEHRPRYFSNLKKYYIKRKSSSKEKASHLKTWKQLEQKEKYYTDLSWKQQKIVTLKDLILCCSLLQEIACNVVFPLSITVHGANDTFDLFEAR
jgi:hypothetical protein